MKIIKSMLKAFRREAKAKITAPTFRQKIQDDFDGTFKGRLLLKAIIQHSEETQSYTLIISVTVFSQDTEKSFPKNTATLPLLENVSSSTANLQVAIKEIDNRQEEVRQAIFNTLEKNKQALGNYDHTAITG